KAIVNARDLAAVKAFYRDRLGLHLVTDTPWWVEFETGAAHVALHPRVSRGEAEAHHAQPVTLGIAIENLIEWADEARWRGVSFLSAPEDQGFGMGAEAVDPDGNVIALREPDGSPALEEQLAEPFDDDRTPARAAIRKTVKKKAHALSRVVVKP